MVRFDEERAATPRKLVENWTPPEVLLVPIYRRAGGAEEQIKD